MWECPKCHESQEDSFEVCWNCGTSRAGVEDPSFRPADQIESDSLEQAARLPIKEIATPGASAHQTTAPRAGRKGYEFSLEQNEVIASLATNMNIVGVISILGGILLLGAGVIQLAKGGVAALIQGALALVVGMLTVQAASAFRKIVDTRGDDIGHLMSALGSLRSLYRLQVILLCIALALLAVVFCTGVVATAAR